MNNIGSAGAKTISEALKINNTLTVVRLAGNKIRDTGAKALIYALTQNSTLQD